MEKYMEAPTSVNCGIDVDDEVKRLEEMKEKYAELFEKSQGKIVVDCAYWNNEYGRAMVHYNVVAPKNHEEYEYEMNMLASDILQAQNAIAREKEVKRYMALRKRKGEDDED